MSDPQPTKYIKRCFHHRFTFTSISRSILKLLWRLMSWRTSWRWVPGLNEFKRLKKQTFWVCNILQTTWQKSVFDEQRPSKTRTNSHNYLMRLIGKNNHTNLMLLTPLAIFGIKLPPRTLEGSPKKGILKILRISNIKTSIQQWLLTPPSLSLRN